MPAYERINVVVSTTLIGLALYFVLEFPAQVAAISFLGSPLEVSKPRQWLMMVLLGALAMAGTDAVVRGHPHWTNQRLSYRATFWMLPGLLIILATQTLGLAPTPIIWAAGLVVVGCLFWLTIFAEFQQVSADGTESLWLRSWRQFMGYTVALIFFIVIYQTRSRSALSATSVVLVSGMTALGILHHGPQKLSETWLFAVIIGLSLGQITWALNYWRTGALNAGLLLFLIFYVLAGLAQQQLSASLTRRTVWEFSLVGAIALLVIFNV